jgi:hypothetical protein
MEYETLATDTASTSRPTFASILSFLSLIGIGFGGYLIFVFYRDAAPDEYKYGSIIFSAASAALCYIFVDRALDKIGLALWSLRSAKICIVVSIAQTLVAGFYLYAVFYMAALKFVFELPVVAAVLTCLFAVHCYMLYLNIAQTRMLFLSFTISIIEFFLSLLVALLGFLYILSKSVKVQDGRGGNPSASNRGPPTTVGPGTYEAQVMVNGMSRAVRIHANSWYDADALLRAQYGENSIYMNPRRVSD